LYFKKREIVEAEQDAEPRPADLRGQGAQRSGEAAGIGRGFARNDQAMARDKNCMVHGMSREKRDARRESDVGLPVASDPVEG